MSPTTLLRFTRSAAVFVVVLAAGWLLLGVDASQTLAWALDAQVEALTGLALAAPVVSLMAMMAGGRLRRSKVLVGRRSRRSPLVIPAQLLTPLTLAGAGAVVVLMSSFAGVAPWSLDPVLLAAAALSMAGWASLGLGLGLALPSLPAALLALATPYVAIGFAASTEAGWVRHLTTVATSCCSLYEVPSAAALTAFVLTAGSMLALGLALSYAAVSRTPVVAGAGAIVGLSLVAVAIHIARPLPIMASDVRDDALLRCQPSSGVQLCLWPEHESARGEVDRLLARVRVISQQRGVVLPTTISEAAPETVRWPEASTIFAADGGRGLEHALARGLFPTTTCSRSDITEDRITPYDRAHLDPDDAVVRQWWLEQLDPGQAVDPDDQYLAEPMGVLGGRDAAGHVAWVNATIRRGGAVCQGVPR